MSTGWHQGERHESRITFYRGGITLTLEGHEGGFGGGASFKQAEREIVECLKAWPHPLPPRSEDEVDYPKWRSRCYDRLMGLEDAK